MGAVMFLIWVAVVVLWIASVWKVYVKAGQPGWAAIIPIYNVYIILKIAGKPGWWLILFFIPLVNIIVAILAYVALAEKFGKGIGFAIGLLLLGIIFWPILAFGDAKYNAGAGAA